MKNLTIIDSTISFLASIKESLLIEIPTTMKTRQALIYPFILSICLFNFGCSPKVDNPTPNNSPQALLGRWEMVEYRVYKKDKESSPARLLGKFGVGLGYIFYDNNTFDGCIQAGSHWDNAGATGTTGKWNCTTDKPGIWKLGNFKTINGFLGENSTITLETPSQQIIQKFKVIIHSDAKLDLELEETKNTDGSVVWAVANFKKVK